MSIACLQLGCGLVKDGVVRGLALVLFGFCCQEAQAVDPVTERGLRHTTQDRDVVSSAVVRASKLLTGSGVSLVTSWGEQSSPAAGAMVYLVEGQEGSFLTPAAVPVGCRCVFVSPSILKTWVTRNSAGPGRMDLDKGNFLVFVLLHEAGHLRNDSSAAVFRDGEMSQLNIEPSRAKAAEEEADNFAVEVLRLHARQTEVNDAWFAANDVVNELTKLSWNMQAFRTLDEFGAFAVGKPAVYFDNGYSHPNLAWRILRANNLIQQTAATRHLLDAFEEARARGANPKPLYNRK